METNNNIRLQSNSGNKETRFDELASQFNEWCECVDTPKSIKLHFSTSCKHPMTMADFSHFMELCPFFDEERNLEWDYNTCETFDVEAMVEIEIE